MTARKTTTKKKTSRKTAKPKRTAKKTASAKKGTAKKPATKKSDKKLSALDAAAKVLKSAKEPLNTQQLIEQMAAKKYWTSPGGKTPHATLHAALMREIRDKGQEARFQKVDRGLFEHA